MNPPIVPKSVVNKPSGIKCNGCENYFEDLKSHLVSTKCGLGYAMCPDCPKFFETEIKLIRHKVVHKKQNAPKFECGQCQKKLLSQRILNTHLFKGKTIYIFGHFIYKVNQSKMKKSFFIIEL